MRTNTHDIMVEIADSIRRMVDKNKDVSMHGAIISAELNTLANRINDTERNLKDCVNELCLRCGQYENAHQGACDGCRWLKVKEAFRNG